MTARTTQGSPDATTAPGHPRMHPRTLVTNDRKDTTAQ